MLFKTLFCIFSAKEKSFHHAFLADARNEALKKGEYNIGTVIAILKILIFENLNFAVDRFLFFLLFMFPQKNYLNKM